MTTTSKAKYIVVDSKQQTQTVTGTRADFDAERSRLSIYDGDELVASFVGFSSFRKDG